MTFSDPTPRLEFGKKRGALALGCYLAVLSAHGSQSIGEEQRPAGALRIGVLTYQDTNDGMSSLERSLIGLRDAAGLDEHFEVASGTYADLLHWLEIGAVDLAIVSPAILGKALELGGPARWEYLASVRTAPDPSPSLSVALVRKYSPIRTAEDLRSLLVRGRGRLLFVDPLSVSGALAPRVALAAASIPVPESRIRYTHSHTNSLRALRSRYAEDTVAFVWNGMLDESRMAGLRTLELPTLAGMRIPRNALIVRGIFHSSTGSGRRCTPRLLPPLRRGPVQRLSPMPTGATVTLRCGPGSPRPRLRHRTG